MMDNDELEIIEAIAKGTVKGFFFPLQDIVTNIAGPPSEQIGFALRDSVFAWRIERLVKIAHKVRKAKEEFGLQLGPVDPAISVPILDAATLESDEDLQDRWVALLVNVASRPEDDVRGFPEILRQLTPPMARFLDRAVDENLEDYQAKIKELTAKGSPPNEFPIPVRLRPETVATMTDVQIGHLERLGLVRANRSPGYGDPEIYMFRATDPLYISPLSKSFVRACRLTPTQKHDQQGGEARLQSHQGIA